MIHQVKKSGSFSIFEIGFCSTECMYLVHLKFLLAMVEMILILNTSLQMSQIAKTI